MKKCDLNFGQQKLTGVKSVSTDMSFCSQNLKKLNFSLSVCSSDINYPGLKDRCSLIKSWKMDVTCIVAKILCYEDLPTENKKTGL
jgi:hypothetical protein